MPGILGFVTANPDEMAGRTQLSRMLNSMMLEDGYRFGTVTAPELGCYVGWVNRSEAAPVQVASDRDDVVVVLAGEHFSHSSDVNRHRSDRLQDGQRGAGWLLDLYERLGEDFVGELNGWFSGVVIDRRRSAVLVFNDRFGVSRVYCREARHEFLFASEAKALLSVRPETRVLDQRSVGHFLGFGTVFGNRTLFAHVSLLPAASCWSIERWRPIQKRTYFDPLTWSNQPPLDATSFYGALRETVSRVVPAYFRASAPVGLSLTGGLDTRIMMAAMPGGMPPMPSYTYAGAYRDCYDMQIAGDVAASCGQPHQVIALGSDFFTNFPAIAEQTVWTTDGCLDLCGAHEIYFSRRAKTFSPIRLTGNYGSEVLRSVSTFKYSEPRADLFDASLVRSTAEAQQAFTEIRDAHPVTFAAFQEIPWNLFGRLAAAQSQLTVRSPYMDHALVALMYQAPRDAREANVLSRRLVADLNPRLAQLETDMGYGGPTTPTSVIRRLHRFAQFKAEWYYNTGMPQWLARFDGTRPLRAVEPWFLGRHKIDHYRLWFRDELKAFMSDLLDDRRSSTRPYLNRTGYLRLLSEHRRGGHNVLNDLNKVATLELINRLLIERDYREVPSITPLAQVDQPRPALSRVC